MDKPRQAWSSTTMLGRFIEPALRPAYAGAAAIFSCIGLARFAYVPLFPALVGAGWVSGPEAGLIGGANLAGYLAGVLGGRAVGARIGTARSLDLGMALTALAFVACGVNAGVVWLGLWRAVAGVATGILMALTGPAVQGAVPIAWRGRAGGIVVTGAGAGVIAASLLVPFLLQASLPAVWLGLALVVVLLWWIARPAWPDTPVEKPTGPRFAGAGRLYLVYAGAGAGIVPHMVFFVDMAVRGRGYDTAAGAGLWLLFGAGAIGGTLIGGRAADRFGGLRSLQAWAALQGVALAAALVPTAVTLALSAILGGFAGIGITAVALARARELAGPSAGSVWVRATAGYAVTQAATAFALTALFATTGSHDWLFAAGLALSLASLAAALLGQPRPGV